jgi:hypothetical protein
MCFTLAEGDETGVLNVSVPLEEEKIKTRIKQIL